MKKINCVLLIDDDSTSNYLNESVIQELNIAQETKVLTNATEALNYLRNDCEGDCPELIFLDIKMPGMDGFRFMEALKKMMAEKNEKIKVVMLSSSLLHRDIQLSKEAGAIDFISKPLTTDKVARIVDLHFN